jgi:hypothetical protein
MASGTALLIGTALNEGTLAGVRVDRNVMPRARPARMLNGLELCISCALLLHRLAQARHKRYCGRCAV